MLVTAVDGCEQNAIVYLSVSFSRRFTTFTSQKYSKVHHAASATRCGQSSPITFGISAYHVIRSNSIVNMDWCWEFLVDKSTV